MALNTCEMWSTGIKIVFFPKTYKNRPAAGGFAPRPPSVIRLSTIAYSWLTQHVSYGRHLLFLTINFRPLPIPKSWLSAYRLQLQIFQSTISLAHKKVLFWKFLMTSLHMICGLGPPNQKSWLRVWSGGKPSSRWRLWGSNGFAPSCWAIFRNFLEKKAILILLDYILHVFRAIWKY